MNLDKFSIEADPLEILKKVKELLSQLPQELAKRWETELNENKRPATEILKIVEEIVSEREEMKHELTDEESGEKIFNNNLEAGLKKITEELIDLVAKEAKDGRLYSIGDGQTAKVVTSRIDSRFCFKVIHDPAMYQKGNDVKQETEYLNELVVLGEEEGVEIPRPYYYKMDRHNHTCVMERLDAFDLQDALTGKEILPENFNLEKFFSALEKFVLRMHEEKNIFHRDLHGGNIMINRKTGGPCIIDFGAAKREFAGDELEAYKLTDPFTGEITELTKDELKIAEHKKAMNKLLKK